jgi:GntR family transcriptional regulator/MocR family aminotransferase
MAPGDSQHFGADNKRDLPFLDNKDFFVGMDSAGRVVYMGTFSKVLYPALRLGYVVAPPGLLKGLIAARRFIDVHLPQLEQMALADFMREGYFARHLRHMRQLYLERRNALVDALDQELGDLLDVVMPEAGMHLTAWLPFGMSDQVAARMAAAQGLDILPLSSLSLHPLQRGGLLLGFASTSPEALRSGVKTLARVLQAL